MLKFNEDRGRKTPIQMTGKSTSPFRLFRSGSKSPIRSDHSPSKIWYPEHIRDSERISKSTSYFRRDLRYVESNCEYSQMTEKARDKLTDLFFGEVKVALFKRQEFKQSLDLIYTDIANLKSSQFSEWDLSTFEWNNIQNALIQLHGFLKRLVENDGKIVKNANTLQRLFTLYLSYWDLRHKNRHTDISILYYLCNFRTNRKQYIQSMEVLANLPDLEMSFGKDLVYDDRIEIVLLGWSGDRLPLFAQDLTNFNIKLFNYKAIKNFNARQRERYFSRKCHFGLVEKDYLYLRSLNLEKLDDSENMFQDEGNYQKLKKDLAKREKKFEILLEYFIVPHTTNDYDCCFFIAKASEYLSQKFYIDCYLLFGESHFEIKDLNLKPQSNLKEMLVSLFGKEQASNYTVLEKKSDFLIESVYNSRKWTINPVQSPSFLSSFNEILNMISSTQKGTIIEISTLYYLLSELGMTNLFPSLMHQTPNFGTDLWVKIDQKDILIQFGLFPYFCKKKNISPEDEETVILYDEFMEDFLSKDSLKKTLVHYDVKSWYYDKTLKLVFIDQSSHFNFENLFLLSFKKYELVIY